MADLNIKLPENVPGRFYVDATCIDCDLCRETAPANFVREDAEGYSYVKAQPATPAAQADVILQLSTAASALLTGHPK